MTARAAIGRFLQRESVNFLLTNRIPRRALTRFMGWFGRIEQPWVRDLSIAAWRFFADVDLRDARKTGFASLHDCFTRELRDGARPVDADPSVLISPCDAIVGTSGPVRGDQLIQAKGFTYTLADLLHDAERARAYRDGTYATLRLTSGMYHRFHAPHDCCVEQVIHLPGDVWNVNPIALKRVERLFCRNERVVLRTSLAATGHPIALVAVAAILVSGIRLSFIDLARNTNDQPRAFRCDAELRKGDQMGWFEHGSTIIVFAPRGFALCANVKTNARIRVGQPLFKLP